MYIEIHTSLEFVLLLTNWLQFPRLRRIILPFKLYPPTDDFFYLICALVGDSLCIDSARLENKSLESRIILHVELMFPSSSFFYTTHLPSALTMEQHQSWHAPSDYKARQIAVIGAGVLGRRIGKNLPLSWGFCSPYQQHAGHAPDTTSISGILAPHNAMRH